MTRTVRPEARGFVIHRGSKARSRPFQARIGVLGRQVCLGYFSTEQEAAAARSAGLKLAEALVPSLRSAEAVLRRLEVASRTTERPAADSRRQSQ